MESFNEKINASPENFVPRPETEEISPEVHEFVPKFEHIKEDLGNLFNIEVTSETSLTYPWVKDELYQKVVEDFTAGKPFALDYMFEEGLLTKEDLEKRGIQDMKPQALTIIKTIKGPRLTRIKDLFMSTGILTQEEVGDALYSSKN